jgi:hypothetical protein
MSDYTELANRYLAVWNEADTERRRAAIAELWTEDGGYTDPVAAVKGHDGIEAVISGAREQFPGFVFSLLGAVDGHHDMARFQWGLALEGSAEPVVIGFDVAVLAEDGRLRDVLGFLDKVPTA